MGWFFTTQLNFNTFSKLWGGDVGMLYHAHGWISGLRGIYDLGRQIKAVADATDCYDMIAVFSYKMGIFKAT